jgi:SAM-dependent methyltransferase
MTVCDELDESGRPCRRLRFFSRARGDQYVSGHIQSEMALIDGLVSPSPLLMPYCKVTIACLSLCRQLTRVLILGNGAGSLSSFIATSWPHVQVMGVERDTRVAGLARKFFRADDFGVNVIISNALDYMRDSDSGQFSVIIVDINADSESDIDAPSIIFLQEPVLSELRRILDRNGVLLIDLLLAESISAQGEAHWLRTIRATLRVVFPFVEICSWSRSDNFILCCSLNPLPSRSEFPLNLSRWLINQPATVQQQLQHCQFILIDE